MWQNVMGLFVIALQAIFLTAISTDAIAAQSAQKLFRQAIAADTAGDSARRGRLLEESLRADPDFNLARWYRGEVLFSGEWKSIGAIQRIVASDPRWNEYRSRLEETDNSIQSHAALARWCDDKQLTYEAKWHWLNVLLLDPQNREALGSLGVRHYQGQLLTDKQIAEIERREKKAAADFKRYSKQFQQWIRSGVQKDAAERSSVLRQFSAVSDEDAIPALVDSTFLSSQNEKLIRAKLDSTAEMMFLQGLRQSVVNALGEMKSHDATLHLLEIAVDWPDAEIRSAAAHALKYRERTSYMPQLMGALAEPINLEIAVHVLPNGQVSVDEHLAEAGPLSEISVSKSSTYLTQYRRRIPLREQSLLWNSSFGGGMPVIRPRLLPIQVWSNRARDFANATRHVANTQQRVEVENALREERNKRIVEVFQIATGDDLGTEPRAWWDAWAQYNELDTPDVLPIYESDEVYDYSQIYNIPTVSCFAAGTPVWTQAGPVAIETIQVGDMVLSQDPLTGELDYRPVTTTTIRPPSPTVKLVISGELITATRGHRFWITGDGWQMAKFLKTGDRLWTLDGSQMIDSVEPSAEAEAFNLVVGQFHTYFVGRSKTLVHDNRCPLPNTTVLPGVKDLAKLAVE